MTLFYAALEAQGDPPCISSPDGSFTLSSENCPAPLASAFRLWQECVPGVRRYDEEARGDLARMVCEKEPEGMPLRMDVARTAADLKGIALEILQVRGGTEQKQLAVANGTCFGRTGADTSDGLHAAPDVPDSLPSRPAVFGRRSYGSGWLARSTRKPAGGV